MEKSDAVRKVMALQNLADDAGATAPERTSAKLQVDRLREKYGVTDDDIEMSDPALFQGILGDVFYWSREIEPLLTQAVEHIEKAIAKIDRLPLNERLRNYSRLHHEMKHAVEETGYSSSKALRLKLKTRRNAVIKEAYEAEWRKDYEDYLDPTYRTDPNPPDYDTKVWYAERAHEWAIQRVASGADIRRDVIQRVVGKPTGHHESCKCFRCAVVKLPAERVS